MLQAVSPGELAVNEGNPNITFCMATLTLHVAGDVVTVTDPDVGQGWCQATSSDGTVGVVPEVIKLN